MELRVQNDLRTLFPRHGIRPLAGWSTLVSPVSPAFVYITPWADMTRRSASWAGFYGDPDWAEVRSRTNGSSELVENYEIMFLREIVPWRGAADSAAFSELIIQNCAVGKAAAVAAELGEHTVPAIEAAGGRVHGLFDIMSGRPLPAIVAIVGWDSLDQRSAAMSRLDDRLQTTRGKGEPVLLDRAEQHLLRYLSVNWA